MDVEVLVFEVEALEAEVLDDVDVEDSSSKVDVVKVDVLVDSEVLEKLELTNPSRGVATDKVVLLTLSVSLEAADVLVVLAAIVVLDIISTLVG